MSTLTEVSVGVWEGLPPAYTEHIGRHLIAALEVAA